MKRLVSIPWFIWHVCCLFDIVVCKLHCLNFKQKGQLQVSKFNCGKLSIVSGGTNTASNLNESIVIFRVFHIFPNFKWSVEFQSICGWLVRKEFILLLSFCYEALCSGILMVCNLIAFPLNLINKSTVLSIFFMDFAYGKYMTSFSSTNLKGKNMWHILKKTYDECGVKMNIEFYANHNKILFIHLMLNGFSPNFMLISLWQGYDDTSGKQFFLTVWIL